MPRFTDDGPLAQYFAEYPSFVPNPNKSATSEFNRMCKVIHLAPRSDAKEAARAAFKDALTQEFNEIYGTEINSLASWQTLCARIGISPIPTTLEECRQIVMNTHVNLVDLTTGSGTIQIFQSVQELSQYTIENRKFFPSENAHAGDLLRYLLRHIFNPGMDSDREEEEEEEEEEEAVEVEAEEGRVVEGVDRADSELAEAEMAQEKD
ncbi:hypothetical protein BDZ97DRAFT_1763059 [Flammula alnicola]|nr:hypothetical protein BDZ97DRAFT_1763059 [Flammula alnicola]